MKEVRNIINEVIDNDHGDKLGQLAWAGVRFSKKLICTSLYDGERLNAHIILTFMHARTE